MGTKVDWPSSSKGEEDAVAEDAVEQQHKGWQKPEEPIQEEAEETRTLPPRDWQIKQVKPCQG